MRGLAVAVLVAGFGCASDDGSPVASETGSGESTTTTGSTTTTSSDTGSTSSSSSSSDDSTTGDLPEPLPPLGSAPRTVDQTIVPTHAIDDEATMDPRVPEQRDQMLDDGFGDVELG